MPQTKAEALQAAQGQLAQAAQRNPEDGKSPMWKIGYALTGIGYALYAHAVGQDWPLEDEATWSPPMDEPSSDT